MQQMQQPPGPPQLPPQMFTTAAQLLDLTDKKLLLVLRDGRKLLGVLRSWDQFANLILTSTVERYFATTTHDLNSTSSTGSSQSDSSPSDLPQNNNHTNPKQRNLYCDVPRGTYLVRGENVLLLGEVDLDRDDEAPPGGWEVGDVSEVFALQKQEEMRRRKGEKGERKRAAELWGGEIEGSGEVLFY